MIDRITEFLVPIASKMTAQRHLSAIREAFIGLMPLIIIGSFMVLINNVVLSNDPGGLFGPGSPLAGTLDLTQFKEIGVSVWAATLNILALLVAYGIGYKLAQNSGMDGFLPGFVSLASVVAVMPVTTAMQIAEIGSIDVSVFNGAFTSASGMFVSIIVGLLASELLIRLMKSGKLEIKMPEEVPPAVAKSFVILLPAAIVILLFAVIAFILKSFFAMNIYEIINAVIQAPLQSLFQGLPGITLIMFIQNLLWAFGIHGSSIMSPFTEPVLLEAITQNAAAVTAGLQPTNIVTGPFINAYTIIGGGGCTISLLIAVFIFSKRADYKAIAKLSIVPSFFNINEPVMFGMPVVLNPILMIPVVLVPTVNLIIAYFATAIGLVGYTYVIVPWTTPPVLSAFLAAGGDWRSAVLAALLIVLGVAIYLPFVLIANRTLTVQDEVDA